MKRKTRILAIGTLSTAILLGGCTTNNPYTGESQLSDTSKGMGIGAIGGAVVGGLLGGRDGALIGAAVGGVGGAAIGNSMDQENKELRERLVGTGVQVQKVGNSVQLVMASDVTFAFNSADINSDFYPTLNSVAVVLRKFSNTSITISGYTDNVGSDAYNQVLSERRAKSVGDYLASQGIDPNRIFTRGFGKRNPVATNATAEGRAANRRVVITLRPIR